MRFLVISQPNGNIKIRHRIIEEADVKETRRDSVPADIYFLP